MIKNIFTSSTSAAFEWQNESAYYTDRDYKVYVNGETVYEGNTNVFSLFNLLPDTEYELSFSITEYKLVFRTLSESAALSVRDFGAVGDGVSDDTLAIKTAVNCLPRNGRLYFPEGTYITAPINLKSHITLDIPKGACILGIPDKSRYPVVPGELIDMVTGEAHCFGTWEGNIAAMHQSLIFAEYAENITIVGQGTVDGNAENAGWWINAKQYKPARPRLLFFNRCSGIRVHGITACNSASWQIHPYFSSDIDLIDLFVKAPERSPNTDAIDPEACDRVDIIGCRFSVGDDCIAIKSGKIDVARRYKTPATRHTVRNCLMQSGHGAVTLGSELAGGVAELTVNRCVFNGTDRGLRIKTRRGRGKDSIVDGVVFENIRMSGVKVPIVINSFYHCDPDGHEEYVWSREKLPVDDRTPYLGKFVFRDMECMDCHYAACYCDGLPERPIKSVTLENIRFTYALDALSGKPASRDYISNFHRAGMYFDNVESLVIRRVDITGHSGERLVLGNVEEVTEL